MHVGGRPVIIVDGKNIPTELGELVDPGHTALLVVDMQNTFCAKSDEDASRDYGDAYLQIIPRIAGLVRAARSGGVLVIHVRMLILPNGESDSPAWIRMRMRAAKSQVRPGDPPSLLPGSWGADFVPEMQPGVGDVVVTKYRSSAFHDTGLEVVLRSKQVRTVVVTGCTTEGCIESTIRDAGMRDYFPVLVSDCVASDDPALHEASMRVMSAYRTDVTTSGELGAVWDSAQ